MSSYIVLGHGVENLKGARPVVPPDCTLVLTEECGMSGVLPYSLYAILADPANKPLFDDPVRHKAEVEALLRRPIRIYTAGESYPILTYTLLSHDSDHKTTGPSGLFALPTPSFVFDPTKRGEARHLVTGQEAPRAFAGAVVPTTPPPAQPLLRLAQLASIRKTQAELFAARPGVHYSLLCRAIPEEDRIKELIEQSFPGIDKDAIFTKEGDDPFQTAAHWIATLEPKDVQQKNKRLAVAQIKTIIADVMKRRRASGSPLGSQGLMTLLAMRAPPAEALTQALVDLDDTERRDRRTGYTPLMLAALMSHVDIVHALLHRGANPNSRDFEGTTPLIFACSAGSLEICKALLAKGADPLLTSQDGISPLLVACSKKPLTPLIPELLALGADPRLTDDDGDTALHIAASNGLHPIIMNLVAAGVDPNSQNKEGKTPLMLAAEDGELEALRVLIPITNINIRSLKEGSALGIALSKGKEAVALELVGAGATVLSWKKLHEGAVAKGLFQLAALVKSRASSSERRRTRTNRVKKSSGGHRRTSSHH